MQRIALVIVTGLVLVLSTGFDKKQNCDAFKRGKFISAFNESRKAHAIFDRTVEGIQTEVMTYHGETKTAKYKIKWHDDCRYTLYRDKSGRQDPFNVTTDTLQVFIKQVLSAKKAVILINVGGEPVSDTIIKIE